MTFYLKTGRKVDSYIPTRQDMTVYQDAVRLATTNRKWQKHPSRKKDVPINAYVVHDKKTDRYFVFMTTDTSRTAWQIIDTYKLCPEIEENFRQTKDFWRLEDFKSTKYNYITYHIIIALMGYLYFQVYKNLNERKVYAGKSLPVVVKNYKETRPSYRRGKISAR